jgi:hypothetical protein
MKRALKKSDVAEQLTEPNRIRVALGTAALTGQQHDRKIRPRRLVVEPAHQAAQIRGLDRLVRDHGKPGAGFDLTLQRRQIVADIGVVAGLLDQRRSDGGIASRRREDDGTLGGCAGFHGDGSCSSGLFSPT